MATMGAEWNTWLAAADATDVQAWPPADMSDARMSTEAAVHGQGVALGDTITASQLIARGELIAPFDLTVPANNAFFVACRNEVHTAPIVRVFIDWLFASLDAMPLAEPRTFARKKLRVRQDEPARP